MSVLEKSANYLLTGCVVLALGLPQDGTTVFNRNYRIGIPAEGQN